MHPLLARCTVLSYTAKVDIPSVCTHGHLYLRVTSISQAAIVFCFFLRIKRRCVWNVFGGLLQVGGSVDAGLNGKSSTLQSYSVGAATGGARWGASLTCINRLQTYNASGYYLINDKVIGSVLASCTPEKSQNS